MSLQQRGREPIGDPELRRRAEREFRGGVARLRSAGAARRGVEAARAEAALLDLVRGHLDGYLKERSDRDALGTRLQGQLSRADFDAQRAATADLGFGDVGAGVSGAGAGAQLEVLENRDGRFHPWEPTYDQEGRLVVPRNRGRVRAGRRRLRVGVLAARGLPAGASPVVAAAALDGREVARAQAPAATGGGGGRAGAGAGGRSASLVGLECEALADPLDVASMLALEVRDKGGTHIGEVRVPVSAVGFAGERPPLRWTALQPPEPAKPRDCGELCLRCFFDADAGGRLHVHVLRAEGLLAADANGKSDPYCTLRVSQRDRETGRPGFLEGPVQRTSVRPETLQPVWGERFAFEGVSRSPARAPVLLVEVWDKDRFDADDPLGQLEVPLANICPARPADTAAQPFWCPLDEHAAVQSMVGALNFEACFSGKRRERLLVRLVQATSLRRADAGQLSPFVVLAAGRSTCVTKPIENTVRPRWDETFAFSAPAGRPFRPRQDDLTLTLFSRSRVTGRDVFLGEARFPLYGVPVQAMSGRGRSGSTVWAPLRPAGQARAVRGDVLLRLCFEGEADRRVGETERAAAAAAAAAPPGGASSGAKVAEMAPEFFGARAHVALLGPGGEELEYDVKPPRPSESAAAGRLFSEAHAWYYLGERRERQGPVAPEQMARWFRRGFLTVDAGGVRVCGIGEGEPEPPRRLFQPLLDLLDRPPKRRCEPRAACGQA